MGTHADEQWAKGLEECSNPEHQHLKQPGTDVELIHWKMHNRAISDVEYARLQGYKDGLDEGIAMAKEIYVKPDWFVVTLRVVLLVYVGIVIGMNI